MWKFSYSFRIMAIFYFINWIVATETIEGGKTICVNTVCRISILIRFRPGWTREKCGFAKGILCLVRWWESTFSLKEQRNLSSLSTKIQLTFISSLSLNSAAWSRLENSSMFWCVIIDWCTSDILDHPQGFRFHSKSKAVLVSLKKRLPNQHFQK